MDKPRTDTGRRWIIPALVLNIALLGLSGWTALAGASEGPTLLSVFPNPGGGPLSFRVLLPSDGWVRLRLFDARGHFVATVTNSYERAGLIGFQWSGLTGHGRRASAGAYFARVDANRTASTMKFVVAH